MKKTNLITVISALSVLLLATTSPRCSEPAKLPQLDESSACKVTSQSPSSQSDPFNQKSLEKLDKLNFIQSSILSSGQEEMKKHKAVITGITRDNASDHPVMIAVLEELGSLFGDYRILLSENDSSDGTVEGLKAWQGRNPKVKSIFQKLGVTKRPSIQFLANVRNKYLEALESDKEYVSFDLVIPVDMDMCHGIDLRGIIHSFSQFSEWDVVGSNGIFNSKGQMYDMFAFRNKEFPFGFNEVGWGPYWSGIVAAGQKVYNPESALVPVYSCFGGLAIYKRQFTEGCRYASINGDCEHVPFHKKLIEKGARIFMNPAQVIRYAHYK